MRPSVLGCQRGLPPVGERVRGPWERPRPGPGLPWLLLTGRMGGARVEPLQGSTREMELAPGQGLRDGKGPRESRGV